VIRFSAALVVVAIGVLVGGMAASSLLLVYAAIGLAVAALLALALGVALKREEIFGEPFGEQAAAFGQAAWAAAPDMHSGSASVPRTGAPWSPPVPQQPAAQARADVAQTRLDTALTPRPDLAKTRTDPPGVKADPAETKAGTAAGHPAALSWFDRIAPARSADDDVKAEDADPAGSPAGESAAKDAGETIVEDAVTVTAEDEAEAETADTNAAADTVVGNTVVANTVVANTVAEPSAAGPDAETKAEDGQREVTVVPGVPRYHDADCILIRFMGDDDLQKMTLDEATEAGCTPCRACVPEHG
jgi:hypothetical protein